MQTKFFQSLLSISVYKFVIMKKVGFEQSIVTHILKPKNVGVTAFVKEFFLYVLVSPYSKKKKTGNKVTNLVYQKRKEGCSRRITLYWDNVNTQKLLYRTEQNVFI